MNKTLLLHVIAGTFVAASAGLFGQTASPAPAAAAPAGSWTITPAFVSQYMFRGMRLGGPSFQPTLEYASGGFAGGLWASVPLDDTVPDVSDPEIDLYGSYTVEFNDAASVAFGGTVYVFPNADKSAGFYETTFEPSVAFNYTINGFRLTPKLYYDLTLDGITAELTAFYAVPLPDIGSELDFTATAGTFKWDEAAENTSPSVKNWGDYWSVGVAMPFQISANSKVTLGVAYAKGSNNYVKEGTRPREANSAAVGRGVASIAYSITF